MSRRAPAWARLADEQLLDLRLRDLRLRLHGTAVKQRVERLYRELAARGIGFRPHAWFAEGMVFARWRARDSPFPSISRTRA